MRPTINGSIPASVDALLAYIEELPPEAWLALGADHDAERAHSTFSTALLIRDAAIADHALDCTAWLVRDAVETLAWLAQRRLGRASDRDRARLTRARERIERAALALVVRDALPPVDFDALYVALEPTVPLPAARDRWPRGSEIWKAG